MTIEEMQKDMMNLTERLTQLRQQAQFHKEQFELASMQAAEISGALKFVSAQIQLEQARENEAKQGETPPPALKLVEDEPTSKKK